MNDLVKHQQTQLVSIQQQASVISAKIQIMRELQEFATEFVRSGLAPYRMTDKEALFIMLKGQERGLDLLESFEHLHVVKGRICPTVHYQVALCQASPLCKYFRCIEATNRQATWETQREGLEPERVTFTWEQALKAGLVQKKGSLYPIYPERLMSARAAVILARQVFPGVVGGLSSKEEVQHFDDEVTVEVIEPQTDPDPKLEQQPQAVIEITTRTEQEVVDLLPMGVKYKDALKITRELNRADPIEMNPEQLNAFVQWLYDPKTQVNYGLQDLVDKELDKQVNPVNYPSGPDALGGPRPTAKMPPKNTPETRPATVDHYLIAYDMIANEFNKNLTRMNHFALNSVGKKLPVPDPILLSEACWSESDVILLEQKIEEEVSDRKMAEKDV